MDVTPPEEVPTSTLATPKKPRKPRPPKLVAKLAKVSETTPTSGPSSDVADVEVRPSKEPLPLEFWAGLMQTQKVVMAQRKTERYNSFRIT